MGSPFTGPRHRSWASDTVIFGVVFVIVVVITALADYLNGPADPPAYLVGLCGAAGSALFGAASSDKGKREREIGATATRAESKADDALGRSSTSFDVALHQVLEVQERELATNRASLRAMLDAVEVKELNGIPVLQETFTLIEQSRAQIKSLVEDIAKRRQQIQENTSSPPGGISG
jgi:hypothetical protein